MTTGAKKMNKAQIDNALYKRIFWKDKAQTEARTLREAIEVYKEYVIYPGMAQEAGQSAKKGPVTPKAIRSNNIGSNKADLAQSRLAAILAQYEALEDCEDPEEAAENMMRGEIRVSGKTVSVRYSRTEEIVFSIGAEGSICGAMFITKIPGGAIARASLTEEQFNLIDMHIGVEAEYDA
jgi:predicted DNA-binding protein